MRKSEHFRRIPTAAGAVLLSGALGMLWVSPTFAGDAACGSVGTSCNPCANCDQIFSNAGSQLCNELGRLSNECCSSCNTCSEACDCCDGKLQRFFEDCCGNNLLDPLGLKIGGWAEFGFTFNPDDPANNSNAPVTFNDRANEFMFNQLYLTLSREVTKGDEFSWGGQVDLLIGSDARFTKATGLDTSWGENNSLYQLAMPQLYFEAYAPVGNGLSVKIGHFYTIIGYETVTATGNFFYSHAYTMQYGEPFTHTGALASYDVSDNLVLTGGIVTGWDDFNNSNNNNWSGIGGVTWTSYSGNTSVALTGIAGKERQDGRFPPTLPGPLQLPINGTGVPTQDETRLLYSLVVTQKMGDKWTYVFQHDHGWQDNGAMPNQAVSGFGQPGVSQDAEWYGINQYLFYEINCKTTAGLRFEWFRDDDEQIVGNYNRTTPRDGVRLPIGAANYYELTAGINHKINDCIMIRPEVRWDWSDANQRNAGSIGGIPLGDQAPQKTGVRPYDDGSQGSQVTIGTDVIIRF